mgnify:CR=1 FL=1
MKAMGLPNRLTVFRFGLALGLGACLVNYNYTHWLMTGLCLFVAAAITDLYDGMVARWYDIETDFGKFMDPLADKVTTLVAFIFFVEIPELAWPAWLVIFLIARELAVNSLRTLAANRDVVLSASWTGKYKTAVQMMGIFLVLLGLILFRLGIVGIQWLNGVNWTTMSLILAITIYSGSEYFYMNWPLLKRSSYSDYSE